MQSTPTFTDVANVVSITGPGISRATIDVTAHDSPNGYMEFLGGLRDGGEVSMEINWEPDNDTHQQLITDLDSSTPIDYRVEFPGGATWTFDGILTGFEPSAPHDDKLSASVTFKVTGKPVFDSGESSSSS
jgi:predicted secreted protein